MKRATPNPHHAPETRSKRSPTIEKLIIKTKKITNKPL
jgi:hypothetical protein